MKLITYSNNTNLSRASLGDVVVIEGSAGEGKSSALYLQCLDIAAECDSNDILLVTRENTIDVAKTHLSRIATSAGYDDISGILLEEAAIDDSVNNIIKKYHQHRIICIDSPNTIHDIDELLELANTYDVMVVLTI